MQRDGDFLVATVVAQSKLLPTLDIAAKAVSAAEPASMSPATTEAPADASPAAMDLPMPEPAPVTTDTIPLSFKFFLFDGGLCEMRLRRS